MNFTKMHGCGNDYIYIWLDDKVMEDALLPECVRALYEGAPDMVNEKLADFVRFLSDRHFGIGSDGVIFIKRYPKIIADFEMMMYNADGSRGIMCGNGIRCVGKYVYENGLTSKKQIDVVSCGTAYRLTYDHNRITGRIDFVTVDMGSPVIPVPSVPVAVQDLPHPFTPVSMGNPHAVMFLPQGTSLETLDIEGPGTRFMHHPYFPEGVNTEFVIVDDAQSVRMRVYERGSGETLCCGTGCCAVCVAGALNGLTSDSVTVHTRGGDIYCEWNRKDNIIYMTGPAVTVYEGYIPTEP